MLGLGAGPYHVPPHYPGGWKATPPEVRSFPRQRECKDRLEVPFVLRQREYEYNQAFGVFLASMSTSIITAVLSYDL